LGYELWRDPIHAQGTELPVLPSEVSAVVALVAAFQWQHVALVALDQFGVVWRPASLGEKWRPPRSSASICTLQRRASARRWNDAI
jgi:hypothetical protein